MHMIRHSFSLCLALLCISLSQYSLGAELKAYVSHNIVQMGQFIEFSLQLSGKSASRNPDFSFLNQDFEIVSSASRSSQTQIINGSMSSSTTWTLTISPKSEGAVVIPPLSFEGLSTTPITVVVGKATEKQAADVWFETSVSNKQVYVQAQVRFDLRLYIRLATLSNSQLDDLQLHDAQVIPVGDTKQSEIVNNGIRYYLIERSYFIFPEKSGVLEIPALNFSAIVNEGTRFSNYGTRRRIAAKSEAITLTVSGIPASYPKNAVWLPAQKIELKDSYSSQNIHIGEPVTRTITTTAIGLPASALPPFQFRESGKIKIYPDQGSTEDKNNGQTLIGIRKDALAIIANEAGTLDLPEYRLPWWNTTTNTLEYAVLKQSSLEINAASHESTRESSVQESIPLETTSHSLLWSLTTVFTLLWLATIIIFVWYIRRIKGTQTTDTITIDLNLNTAHKQVIQAIQAHDLHKVRQALLIWAKYAFPQTAIQGLQQLSAQLHHAAFSQYLMQIDQALYQQAAHSVDIDWKQLQSSFVEASKSITQQNRRSDSGIKLEPLYPKR